MLDEIERTYATGIRFDLTPAGGGNFASDAEFLFSFNGVHYEDSYSTALTAVPETSVFGLLGVSLLGMFVRRR